MEDEKEIRTKYVCIYCAETTILDIKEPIKCRGCGSGILLKRRDPNKPVQYFAV